MGSEIKMGLGRHFTREHVTLATFNDRDVALAGCRFGNFHLEFVAFHTAVAQRRLPL